MLALFGSADSGTMLELTGDSVDWNGGVFYASKCMKTGDECVMQYFFYVVISKVVDVCAMMLSMTAAVIISKFECIN